MAATTALPHPAPRTRRATMLLLLPAVLATLVTLGPMAARACSVPPGGCTVANCAALKTLAYPRFGAGLNLNMAIGRYAGGWNTNYPESSSSKRGGPWVNWEVFPALETQYLIASTAAGNVNNLGDCCTLCAQTANCTVYQYFNSKALSGTQSIMGVNSGPTLWPTGVPLKASNNQLTQQCFLLSGGSAAEGPYGVPFSPWKSVQINQNKTIMPSWVGGSCNPDSSVVNDPHFVGAHGTRFDFNGDIGKTFALISDSALHLNIKLEGYLDSRVTGATVTRGGKALRTWIRELGLLWKATDGSKHSLLLVARRGKDTQKNQGFVERLELDGAPVPATAGDLSLASSGLTLQSLGWSTQRPYDVDQYQLRIEGLLSLDLSLRPAHPLLQTEDDAFVHWNLKLQELKASPAVHGVLGQTFRGDAGQLVKALEYQLLGRLMGAPVQADGETGRGFLEGEPADYEVPTVLSSECKFSAFQ